MSKDTSQPLPCGHVGVNWNGLGDCITCARDKVLGSQTPQQILKQLFLEGVADGGTGGSMEDVVSKAAAEIKEAVLAAKPHSSMGWSTIRQIGYDQAANEFEQTILTMFEGE